MKDNLCGVLMRPWNVWMNTGPFPWHVPVSRSLAAERGWIFCAWLFQAEVFRDTVHMLLEWLSEAEQTLRFRGALPDDTEALQSLIDTHKVIQPCGLVTSCYLPPWGLPTTKWKQLFLGIIRTHMRRNKTRVALAHSRNEREIAGGFFDILNINIHS